jgi:hypothetical protein
MSEHMYRTLLRVNAVISDGLEVTVAATSRNVFIPMSALPSGLYEVADRLPLPGEDIVVYIHTFTNLLFGVDEDRAVYEGPWELTKSRVLNLQSPDVGGAFERLETHEWA